MSAFLAELRAKRNLRSTAHLAGPQKKVLFPEPTTDSDEVDISTWFEMNFEIWYRPLQDSTIRTSFISLTPTDVRLFHSHDEAFLESLKEKIDHVITSDFGGSKCFVKLSCRSPKDATVESPQLEIDYREKLAEMEADTGVGSLTDNQKLQLLYGVHLNLLGCSNGEEAVSLLLRSGRIQTDLELAQKESQSMELLVREWVEIPLKGEFRGFVYKSNLTAVSQYFDTLYFAELADFDVARIRRFYDEKIKPRITWSENFVIDFAITEDDTILVIELNPFLPTTDACCFNWFRDSGIIGAEGEDVDRFFEFRRREVEMKSMINVVLTPWKRFFQ